MELAGAAWCLLNWTFHIRTLSTQDNKFLVALLILLMNLISCSMLVLTDQQLSHNQS